MFAWIKKITALTLMAACISGYGCATSTDLDGLRQEVRQAQEAAEAAQRSAEAASKEARDASAQAREAARAASDAAAEAKAASEKADRMFQTSLRK